MTEDPAFSAVAVVENDMATGHELQQLLDLAPETACVCVCHTVRSALQRIPGCAPNVVLIDMRLHDGSGLECARRLQQSLPRLRFVAVTLHDKEDYLLAALRTGVSGYLLKPCLPEEILHAIAAARLGKVLLPRLSVDALLAPPVAALHAGNAGLTSGELRILEMFSLGYASSEVGQELRLAVPSVNRQARRIYKKLRVSCRSEAVIRYLSRLLPSGPACSPEA